MHRLTVAAILAVACATANADVVTFQQGVGGYAGTSDTELYSVTPDANLGGALEISIDASSGGGVSEALLRFDSLFGAGPGQIPVGSTINSAILSLEIVSAGSGINFYRMLVGWDQSVATWNSVGGGIQTDGVVAATTPTLSVGANDGSSNIPTGLATFNLTSDVQLWANGTSNFGWALLPFLPNGTNGVDFDSSESTVSGGATRPLLTVNFTPTAVPAPPAIVLLAVGGLTGFAARVRFRSAPRSPRSC